MHNNFAKKGAIEMSINTVIIIVLGMTLLIGGIVFVNKIIGGSISSIDSVQGGVTDEINKLFSDDASKKVAIRLPNNQIDLKQGESFGFGFGIKNTEEGTSTAGRFTYSIDASSVQTGCSTSIAQANSYIILGKTSASEISISPGQSKSQLVKIKPSSDAAICEMLYSINVKKNGQPYESQQFILSVKSS